MVKVGRCENCNNLENIFKIKITDLFDPDLKESFHTWCGTCISINKNRKIPIVNYVEIKIPKRGRKKI